MPDRTSVSVSVASTFMEDYSVGTPFSDLPGALPDLALTSPRSEGAIPYRARDGSINFALMEDASVRKLRRVYQDPSGINGWSVQEADWPSGGAGSPGSPGYVRTVFCSRPGVIDLDSLLVYLVEENRDELSVVRYWVLDSGELRLRDAMVGGSRRVSLGARDVCAAFGPVRPGV
jgi:hypothetical protein